MGMGGPTVSMVIIAHSLSLYFQFMSNEPGDTLLQMNFMRGVATWTSVKGVMSIPLAISFNGLHHHHVATILL